MIDESGLTTRKLAARTGYSRDKISRSLNGGSRPEWPVVRRIIECSTSGTVLLSEGRHRWEKADPAAESGTASNHSEVESAGDTHAREEIYRKLVDALQQCNALEYQVGEYKSMVLTLRLMESELTKKVDELTRERDTLARENTVLRESNVLEQQLVAAIHQHQRSEGALQCARAERDEAERLRLVAEDQARHWRSKLEALERAQQTWQTFDSPVAFALMRGLPGNIGTDHDIDSALDKAETILAEQAVELSRMADDLKANALYPAVLDSRGLVRTTTVASADIRDNRLARVGQLPLELLEPMASLIRMYRTGVVPDLLQCPRYTEALAVTRVPSHREERLRYAEQVRARQEAFEGPGAPTLWAILDESVLRRPMGSHHVMKLQVIHFLELARRPNVTIQLLPLLAGAPSGGTFTLLRFHEPQMPDIVRLSALSGVRPVERADEIDLYAREFSRLAVHALSPADTIRSLEYLADF